MFGEARKHTSQLNFSLPCIRHPTLFSATSPLPARYPYCSIPPPPTANQIPNSDQSRTGATTNKFSPMDPRPSPSNRNVSPFLSQAQIPLSFPKSGQVAPFPGTFSQTLSLHLSFVFYKYSGSYLFTLS